jgi:hypothetical protein
VTGLQKMDCYILSKLADGEGAIFWFEMPPNDIVNYMRTHPVVGTGVAYRQGCCASSRTIPGSIPVGVTGFFNDIFPSDRTMVLGSTQTLVKIGTTNISGGECGRCVKATTSPPSCAECHKTLVV